MACTIERVHYYDQEAVEAFWAAWRQDVGTGRLRRAGRPRGDGKGNHGGGWGRAGRDRAVATALEELKHAGGYQRGMATWLARQQGGNARSWQRAVAEARTLYTHQHKQDHNQGRIHGVEGDLSGTREAGSAQPAR